MTGTSDGEAVRALPSRSTGDEARTRAVAIDIARALHDDKCEEVVLLDVRGLSQVTDYIVIGTGTSDRQMRGAISGAEELAAGAGFAPFRSDTESGSTWLLLDCVDIVVHLFERHTRAHYDLEMLWGDAPRLEWERPEQRSRNLAGLRRDEVLPG